MSEKRISYAVRDFQSIRSELINLVKTYYPDLIENVNDASVFSMLLDLNAAVTDNLHYHIDRSLQETVLQYAQQKSSIYNIARTYGLKLPGQRPSVALVDFSITVPANGDRDDIRYEGILRRGTQVIGAGQIFETVTDIDFTSPVNAEGFPNKTKIPNFNSNNVLVSYTITKRDVVVNGVTRVFKQTITPNDVKPFLEIFLPEKNILGITSVIQKDGTNYANVPTAQDFLSLNGRWYEVDALAQERIFVEDPSKPSDRPGIKVGKYITTDNRFITEYTPEGFLKMTFGGGNISADEQLRQFARNGVRTQGLQRYMNNFSMGSTLKANTTIFVQYRIGGGLSSNVGVNVLNQVNSATFSVNGPSVETNASVVRSLRCTNVTAAVGGAGLPTLEEVRNFVSFNFASQNRAVTVSDYEALIRKMPSVFGAPAKVAIVEDDNKVRIKILSFDTNGTLTQTVSNTLISNIAEYLSNYRMLNDYILVETADVIDLGIDVDVVLDSSQNQGALVTSIINKITEYFSPLTRQLGENVNISEITRIIQNEAGVLSLSSLKFFGNVGGQYSSSETSMPYVDNTTKEISGIDGVIYALPSQIYQIRFPNKDIRVRVKNFQTVAIS
jgi:hypothetical protein